MPNLSMPGADDRQLAVRLKKLRTKAAQNQSIPLLQSSLELAATESRETHEAYAQQSLSLFIRNNDKDNLLPLISHLLQTTNAALTSASHYITYQSASIPLLECLFEHGWDINQVDEKDNGRRILEILVIDESCIRWLLEHGARVDYGKPVPIMENCARVGSLSTLKLLQMYGARKSQRTLHCAAQAAASCGVDPGIASLDGLTKEVKDRIEVLRYLVEDGSTDINMFDGLQDPVERSGYWGSPLCYAASMPRGAYVTRWLLQRGADPSVGKADGYCNSYWVAKFQGNAEVLAVLETWEPRNAASNTG